jgi:ribonuclease HI
MKALGALKDGFQFCLGDGNSSFWYTDWSGIGALANHVLYVDIHDTELRVRDVYSDGSWNFNSLYTAMPTSIKEQLSLLPINLNPNVPDRYSWKGNLNGLYTARDGYYWLNRNFFSDNPTSSFPWSWIWHISAPEKIKFFLWTMLHSALPTKAMLFHRRIIQDSSCPRCNSSIETTIHCLRDCAFVKQVWTSLGYSDSDFFQGEDLYTWLRHGLDHHTSPLFMAALWLIWCARNKLCIENDFVSLYSLRLQIGNYAQLLRSCFFNQSMASSTRMVKWNAHGGNSMILNVDGSSIGNPGVSGFGGLIRHADGTWIRGFYGNIGVSNIMHAELLALYHGLQLAWELNIRELLCYSDSGTAIKLITEPVDEWHHYAAILHNIKDILARNWRVKIIHTLREGNACADFLAKFGAHNNEALSVMASPPAGLNLLLLADASGTWFNR